MPDNLRHAQYGFSGQQIDDPSNNFQTLNGRADGKVFVGQKESPIPLLNPRTRALPNVGQWLLNSLDTSKVSGQVGCTQTNCTRIGPNGQLLRGVLITANASTTACTVDFNFPRTSKISTGRVAFLIYSTASADLGTTPTMTLYVGNAGFSAFMSAALTVSKPGWQASCPLIDTASTSGIIKWTAAGGAVFGTTDFATARIRFDYNLGQRPTYEVYAVMEDCRPATLAPISFTFDDGYVSQYTLAAPLLETYGLRGSFGLIADLIGSGGYMTWAQVRDLYARGHEICVHGPIGGTGSLLNYTGTTAQRYQAVLNDILYHKNKILSEVGMDAGSLNVYALPQGQYQATLSDYAILDALNAAGMKVIRSTDSSPDPTFTPYGGVIDYLPIFGHLWAGGSEASNISNIQARITNNVNNYRGSIGMFHYVTAGAATQSLEIQRSNLELIIRTAADLISQGKAYNAPLVDVARTGTGLYPVDSYL